MWKMRLLASYVAVLLGLLAIKTGAFTVLATHEWGDVAAGLAIVIVLVAVVPLLIPVLRMFLKWLPIFVRGRLGRAAPIP
jgi:hypothetical protein